MVANHARKPNTSDLLALCLVISLPPYNKKLIDDRIPAAYDVLTNM